MGPRYRQAVRKEPIFCSSVTGATRCGPERRSGRTWGWRRCTPERSRTESAPAPETKATRGAARSIDGWGVPACGWRAVGSGGRGEGGGGRAHRRAEGGSGGVVVGVAQAAQVELGDLGVLAAEVDGQGVEAEAVEEGEAGGQQVDASLEEQQEDRRDLEE